MRRLLTIKNVLVLGLAALIGGDISLLFADENQPDAQTQQQLQQIQALQQQQQQQSVQTPPPLPTQQQLAQAQAPLPQQQAVIPTQTAAPPNAQAPSLPPPEGTPYPQQNVAAPPPATQPPQPAAQAAASSGSVMVGEVSNQAFNNVTQNLLPMTPQQIQRLRQLFDQSQYAAAALPTTPAKPVISSQYVNLAPGSTPPIVRLQVGMVTVMTFLDSTGAPWPIQVYDVGNPSAFNIQWNKTDNTLMIQPLSPYAYGNLAVVLQGLATPVTLSLATGQHAFDARVDLHVQGMGPNAQPLMGSGLPSSADPNLMGVLDGVPPPGAIVLKVSGGTAQAWLSGDQMYVRTRYTILSPGWLATMSSADGMKAYLMMKTPALLATQNGKVVQLTVEGY